MKITKPFVLFAVLLVAGLISAANCRAEEFEQKPADPSFEKFNAKKAPIQAGPYIKAGDRLAIIGDSITEQKMYSRIMEIYLTVCTPELKVSVRQYGWSGETAEGFLNRMKNDCIRFEPTIATTCYGMNDHRYKPYEEAIGKWYTEKYTGVAEGLKAAGARVVLGSPGCVGKMPSWVKSAAGTVDDLNLSLMTLRNLDIDIAAKEQIRFADVFWPMLTAGYEGKKRYGPDYMVAGKDGVHPGWAGQLIMAYAFLKGLGVSGDIGTFTVDLKDNKATVSEGHELKEFKDGALTVESTRYPYCATGEIDKDGSMRSGMSLVPFNDEMNRMRLVVNGATAPKYKVTWGTVSKEYTGDQLTKGVNLANDFAINPFSENFNKIDAAIFAKQSYETKQIKSIFHGPEGKKDMEAAVKSTEAERAKLVDAIKPLVVPVTHTIKIEAAQ